MRPALLCVQRVAPLNALAAELSAADWMRSMCKEGVYATITSTRQRSALHRLSQKCNKLATAFGLLRGGEKEVGTVARELSVSLRAALAREAALRFLPGDELHVTLHVSPDDEALNIYVQPMPPPPASWLDATLSPPLDQAAPEVRDDVHRGGSPATSSWATPLVHPVLKAAPIERGYEETLLHERTTDRVIEGLGSNLFVVEDVGGGPMLRTAAVSEGAYPGSVRDAVLRLAAASDLFPGGVVESAPTASQLARGAWREAWLTCSGRRVAPLARIWQPAEHEGAQGAWAELPQRERGVALRGLLEEEMTRESESII